MLIKAERMYGVKKRNIYILCNLILIYLFWLKANFRLRHFRILTYCTGVPKHLALST